MRSLSGGSRLLERVLERLHVGFRINPKIQLAESCGAFQEHREEAYDVCPFL